MVDDYESLWDAIGRKFGPCEIHWVEIPGSLRKNVELVTLDGAIINAAYSVMPPTDDEVGDLLAREVELDLLRQLVSNAGREQTPAPPPLPDDDIPF